jgi:hypothetical protein
MVSHLYWAKMIAVSQTVSLTFDGYKKQFELSFLSFLHPYSLSATSPLLSALAMVLNLISYTTLAIDASGLLNFQVQDHAVSPF